MDVGARWRRCRGVRGAGPRSVHWKWAGVGALRSSLFRCPSSPQGARVITRGAYHQMVDQSVNGGRKVGHVGGLMVGLR